MWSGPRNLSTAMMYAFASRQDCVVMDEPFYAAYLKASGEVHPMQEAILASQPTDPEEVVQACLSPLPEGKKLSYQKHMSHHVLPRFSIEFTDKLTNVFLIRHPARVIASYHKKRAQPSLQDVGVEQQVAIFNRQHQRSGRVPVVIDSDDLLTDPALGLEVLCDAIGIPFDSAMLSWQPGGNPADGVWAEHWYNAVWQSNGLTKTQRKPIPQLPASLQSVLAQSLPYYELLAKHKLTVG
ncbi:sulfotransferase [Aestuariibacter sp. A3R04]|uniref:sulfotransferase n=1 Tax=Aestuariibacter sp. A3R04 TaxID=2841571 RepID=UPI001C081FDE|nr:sulfotransferase [Aestuariibacter sp. A3R04]MBU3020541.1 sulfotransferase [Aestuariibacter sp. A3R04]